MRYTRDILLDLAKELVEKRYAQDPKVDAVFLVGSVRPEDAVIEGPTDVDLLVLHNGEIPRERELVKISAEYHFDIFFEETNLYSNPKDLRSDGWRGWTMWDPHLLLQRGRFFEYTQSILRSQFDEPKYILARVRNFAESSRKSWARFDADPAKVTPREYLKAVYSAGNAFACLARSPYTKRNFLSQFYTQATEMEAADLVPALMDCVSDGRLADTVLAGLDEWEQCFTLATQAYANYTVHPLRLNYYKDAITKQAQSEFPASSLWPYAFTWAYIAEESKENKHIHTAWGKVGKELGLSADKLPIRLRALDQFLEQIEEIIAQVSDDYGVD